MLNVNGRLCRQGAACHYLACAYFHENAKFHKGADTKLMTFAAGAFQSAAAARLSLGPKHQTAVKEATGSLLFLGKVLVDMVRALYRLAPSLFCVAVLD